MRSLSTIWHTTCVFEGLVGASALLVGYLAWRLLAANSSPPGKESGGKNGAAPPAKLRPRTSITPSLQRRRCQMLPATHTL